LTQWSSEARQAGASDAVAVRETRSAILTPVAVLDITRMRTCRASVVLCQKVADRRVDRHRDILITAGSVVDSGRDDVLDNPENNNTSKLVICYPSVGSDSPL